MVIKKLTKNILLFFLLFYPLYSMKIDRVILSSDTNPYYLDFWPIVAKAWVKMGIKPTLALVGNEPVEIDESLGDIIRIKR